MFLQLNSILFKHFVHSFFKFPQITRIDRRAESSPQTGNQTVPHGPPSLCDVIHDVISKVADLLEGICLDLHVPGEKDVVAAQGEGEVLGEEDLGRVLVEGGHLEAPAHVGGQTGLKYDAVTVYLCFLYGSRVATTNLGYRE